MIFDYILNLAITDTFTTMTLVQSKYEVRHGFIQGLWQIMFSVVPCGINYRHDMGSQSGVIHHKSDFRAFQASLIILL